MIRNDFKKLNIKKLDNLYNEDKNKIIIAGPCSIESEELLLDIAEFVKKNGATVLRGGAYKPRTSNRDFQGLKSEGLQILDRVRKKVGIRVVTEAVDTESMPEVAEVSDIIQIGSRNMQNFTLLREAGKYGKPVILKRGMAATIYEWIRAAEYIYESGNSDIIMCERGIRTFNDYTRNTMDIAAIPIIKKETGLTVIADPSHGTGIRDLVIPMSCASLAAGADGIMVEVHKNPEEALSDKEQTIDFRDFQELMRKI